MLLLQVVNLYVQEVPLRQSSGELITGDKQDLDMPVT